MKQTGTNEEDVSTTGFMQVTEAMDVPEAYNTISGNQTTFRFKKISKVSVGEVSKAHLRWFSQEADT